MIISKTRTKLFFLISCLFSVGVFCAPQLTVIFVVDQFAHHYIDRLAPYMRGGIKHLLRNGVIYENAYYPHAMPATATGHAALNTGCFAKDHGFVSNKWYEKGKLIYCDGDTAENAAVFDKNGNLLDYGKSAKNLVVEGVSDQIVLQENPQSENKVFSLSFKSRAAIATAGSLGKAIWFDNKAGNFTTSKAYFDEFPEWLDAFNQEKELDRPRTITWTQLLPNRMGAYKARNVEAYQFTTFKKSWMNKPIAIPDKKNAKEPYEILAMLPESDKILVDLAIACIDEHLSANKDDKLVIWISFSATDKLGHRFGPNSYEMLDLYYRLDKQIRRFMKKAEARVGQKCTLFALTADHGVAPIPELLQHEGLKKAIRIDEKKLLTDLNALLQKKYAIGSLILKYRTPCFYIDEKRFNNFPKKERKKIIKTVKKFLIAHPGIKTAWTRDELLQTTFEPTDIPSFFKNQIYPGRSGYFFIQVLPFCQTSKYPRGTAHRTPYEDNTHVPLIFYQRGTYEEKTISQRVSMLQFANTLAQAIEVPRAPASTFDILPGLFDPCRRCWS